MSDLQQLYRLDLPLKWQTTDTATVFADTPLGRFNVHSDRYLPRWFVQLRTANDAHCEQAAQVDTIDAGKQLAEEWFVERMREGLVPVVNFQDQLRAEVKTLFDLLKRCQKAFSGEATFPTAEIAEVLGE
jgi:hypothetical protein